MAFEEGSFWKWFATHVFQTLHHSMPDFLTLCEESGGYQGDWEAWKNTRAHTHVHVTCLKCWFVVGSMLFLLCCMACLAFHTCGVPSGAAHRRCASWHLRYGVFKWCVLNCLTVCFFSGWISSTWIRWVAQPLRCLNLSFICRLPGVCCCYC